MTIYNHSCTPAVTCRFNVNYNRIRRLFSLNMSTISLKCTEDSSGPSIAIRMSLARLVSLIAEPKITFEYWLVIVSSHIQFCPVKFNFDWPFSSHMSMLGQCECAL